MSSFFNALAKPASYLHDSATAYNTDGAAPAPGFLNQKITDIEQILKRGVAFKPTDLPTYIDAVKNMEKGTDDRKFLLEKLLVIMSRLPDSSEFSQKLQHFVIDTLYKDLPHPPSGYLTSFATETSTQSQARVKYAYRNTNGSYYNPLFPSLGKAGSAYARSVPGVNTIPVSSLPDPGLVFDTLLRRQKFTPHPGGISSLFFAFADIIIHSIFHTDDKDWTINKASSYLDLSPLYGSSEEQLNEVRRKDGTGRLWEDVFADARLLFMPPASCALLVLFCRNHNYIAQKILDINEWGSYKNPVPQDKEKMLAQDDEIFHRARLVNCGFFMQVILGDYVGAILGLARDGSYWRLNPLDTMREPDHEFAPRGQGNVCSIEFNMLYRWHATLSDQDEKNTTKMMTEITGSKNLNELTTQDFIKAAGSYLRPKGTPRTWSFSGHTRDSFGRFNDAELAKIIQDATEWRANAFGARSTPEALRVIEILGMQQARSWGACSLNEFRKFMGLKPYSTFKEWNPDPEIYVAAERLYHNINNLELHVGMQAEETKFPMPGAGLCPGYTISRAILADAVCLTRGDRYLTTEMTPFNFTSWGYKDCQFNVNDGSFGGMLTKLLFRHLPDYYPARSAYAHFPFLDPIYAAEHIPKVDKVLAGEYIWTRPPAPARTIVVNSYSGVSQVLADKTRFVSDATIKLSALTRGVNIDRPIVKQVLFRQDELQRWGDFFSRITVELIKEKSISHIGNTSRFVDIVQDVINLAPVHWIADQIVGLALKTATRQDGVYRERELFSMFADVCDYMYINLDTSNDWTLREKATKTADLIISRVEEHLTALKRGFASVDGLTDSMKHLLGDTSQSHGFLRQLLGIAGTRTTTELASSIFAEVIPTVAHFSQTIVHVVNFYIDDEYAKVREDIVKLSEQRNPESLSKLLAYVHEALRLDPLLSGIVRTATTDTSIDGGLNVRAGEKVFSSVRNANLDKNEFGDKAFVVDFNRPPEQAGILRLGEFGLLSASFFEATVPSVLAAIFKLKNLRRGPGKSGQLQRFSQDYMGTPQRLYLNDAGLVTPHPTSLIVQYDI